MSIMFLVETDTKAINKSEDYKIKGYKTVIPKKEGEAGQIRIMGLVEEAKQDRIRTREDLMDKDFSSIWMEVKNEKTKNTLVCGFYREWTKDGDTSQKNK